MDTTHCKHGKYVGNMGHDIMCGLCEDGRNTLKKCRDCDVKVWVERGQKLNIPLKLQINLISLQYLQSIEKLIKK